MRFDAHHKGPLSVVQVVLILVVLLGRVRRRGEGVGGKRLDEVSDDVPRLGDNEPVVGNDGRLVS
jgi:hypothetical protein